MTTPRTEPNQIEADLFDYASRYPGRAGYKATDTSAEAAVAIEDSGRAATLRKGILLWLREKPGRACTTDEYATMVDESVLAIRPRFAELHKNFLIRDSGERRRNASGRNAIVWVEA
jgi:hypothetical protein